MPCRGQPPTTATPITLRAEPNGTKTMIGYPSDKPVPSSWIKSGNFTAAPGSRYEHNLDVILGDSGASTYDNGDNRVNGIQSTQW